MKTTGMTIKEIRVSKNIKQEEIYKDLISRNVLWQIENDKIRTNYEVLKEILNRLNISFDEFLYIQNNFESTPLQQLENRYNSIYTSIEIDVLINLQKDIDAYLEYHSSHPLLIDLKKCLNAIIAIEKEDNFAKATAIVSPIWDRISKQNDWYWEDIQIMSHIFYMFEQETALNICKELFNKLNNYRNFKNADRLEISTLLNISTMLLDKGKLNESEQYINKCIVLAEENKYFIQWAYALGTKGILKTMTNNKNEGQKLLNQSINILETINQHNLSKAIQIDYNKYCKKHI
ncbi:helix-turn-helix domain-containing protein [Listeria welshimeri]|uniref:helix-turn-helix domain-containing protein n=1 Tax=Listeria welshimeri TaxID=1643 RepID=UPI0010B39A16|nr:Rgg/GadR/MutR family transcriptional regulator [Listeria welshimeri]EAC2247093.1 Rgg/GadR/MutR family transcriptional regulator [Listeria monocytogenes]EAC4362770.1 Rgg/GadR/MutR family transcriptional regulator [Listeria monocytogenes]EHO5110644.1 helix-turn-helix domain-containing protein [Listeria monocytogenes]MBC1250589.1 helix-turn-helix domain-containing protein [Listeria welshimeri]MBC1391412.1 helix-turn-helix domain-containing protein [Listeria welshimeri]